MRLQLVDLIDIEGLRWWHEQQNLHQAVAYKRPLLKPVPSLLLGLKPSPSLLQARSSVVFLRSH